MTKSDIISKALFLQYPCGYNCYKEYDIEKEKLYKLPFPQNGMMYDGWYKNDNHFTTKYHIENVIPLLCKILHLEYDGNDFVLDERKSGNYDISILVPKTDYRYEIFGYTRNEHFDDLSFADITSNNSTNNDIYDYHRLFKYSHECSRLINKDIASDRKLFISGDSQMIPDIGFLSCFFN